MKKLLILAAFLMALANTAARAADERSTLASSNSCWSTAGAPERGMQLAQEKWAQEQEQVATEQLERETEQKKQRVTAPLWALSQAKSLAPLFGGGEQGKRVAEGLPFQA